VLATRHLDAINRSGGAKAWKLSFSFDVRTKAVL